MTAYGYVRVSTPQQVASGESFMTQCRQIEGYCRMRDLDLGGIFIEDAISGAVPIRKRPMGRQLLAKLRKGDILIGSALDRMFRSALDALQVLEDLKKSDVRLHLLDMGGDLEANPLAKPLFTISAAFAECERTIRAERIREAKEYQKARGRFLGGKKQFGYRVTEDGAQVEDEAEQAAIVEMRALRADGLSLRAIAEAMQAKGFQITHPTVGAVLKGPKST